MSAGYLVILTSHHPLEVLIYTGPSSVGGISFLLTMNSKCCWELVSNRGSLTGLATSYVNQLSILYYADYLITWTCSISDQIILDRLQLLPFILSLNHELNSGHEPANEGPNLISVLIVTFQQNMFIIYDEKYFVQQSQSHLSLAKMNNLKKLKPSPLRMSFPNPSRSPTQHSSICPHFPAHDVTDRACGGQKRTASTLSKTYPQ